LQFAIFILQFAIALNKKPGPQARFVPHEQLEVYCTCNRKNLCGSGPIVKV